MWIAGDTVGCGIDFTTGRAFFTKNGKFIGEPEPIRALCRVLPGDFLRLPVQKSPGRPASRHRLEDTPRIHSHQLHRTIRIRHRQLRPNGSGSSLERGHEAERVGLGAEAVRSDRTSWSIWLFREDGSIGKGGGAGATAEDLSASRTRQ